MFCVRDEMFDYAADGNIGFDDPAYQLLRREMNGLIRYGHQLTFFRSLIEIGIRRLSGGGTRLFWNDAWENALAMIDSEAVKAKMKSFHDSSDDDCCETAILEFSPACVCVGVCCCWTASPGRSFQCQTVGQSRGEQNIIGSAR